MRWDKVLFCEVHSEAKDRYKSDQEEDKKEWGKRMERASFALERAVHLDKQDLQGLLVHKA